MKRRWYRRCGADFIHGTMGLSLEEKGAYSLCLDLIYDRGGPIPDDARWLAGICGVSIRKWNAIRGHLITAGKLTFCDGHLSNQRAEQEIVSAELSSRKLAENGAKGGRNRVKHERNLVKHSGNWAENEHESNENNDLGQAGLKHLREEKRREDSVSNDTDAADAADPEKVMFDHGLAFLASRGFPDAKSRSILGKWKRDHGAATVIEALSTAKREGAIEPVSFIEAALRMRNRTRAQPVIGI